MYRKQISQRLDHFIQTHMEMSDDSSTPEYGPGELSLDYVGPDWAYDLAYMATEPSEAATWGIELANQDFWLNLYYSA